MQEKYIQRYQEDYAVNLITLAVVALVLMCALIGYKRGLIKSVLSAAGIVGAIILANILNPYVADFLADFTSLREDIHDKIEVSMGVDELEEQLTVYDQEKLLESMDMPELVKNYIRSGNASLEKGQTTVVSYIDYVVDYLTDMVMKGVAYLLTVVITSLIILILLALSNILPGIPVLNGLNRWGGVIFGIVQAILITWVAMLVITFMSAFSWAKDMMDMIDGSAMLSYLYDNNVFLKVVTGILESI